MYPCEENITENIRKIILSSCMYISVDEDWKMCSSCCWLYLSVFSRQPSESNRSECNTGKSALSHECPGYVEHKNICHAD